MRALKLLTMLCLLASFGTAQALIIMDGSTGDTTDDFQGLPGGGGAGTNHDNILSGLGAEIDRRQHAAMQIQTDCP